jgi:hypothetical protein
MQYVRLDIVRYAAAILAAANEANQTLFCEVQPCEEPVAYLIPNAARPGWWRTRRGATPGNGVPQALRGNARPCPAEPADIPAA